jgi:hypothetical protein
MNRTKIAALLTCFNRKQKTLACLEALFNQVLTADVDISAYLVDAMQSIKLILKSRLFPAMETYFGMEECVRLSAKQ